MNTKLMVSLAAALAALSGAAGAESGLKPPVQFQDTSDPWVAEVDLDRAQYSDIVVTSVLRAGAHELGRERLPVSTTGVARSTEPRVTVTVPLEQRAWRGLKDGVYVQRVIAEALPNDVGAPSYRAQRAFYFAIADGRAERISMREYSAVTDPPIVDRDAAGQPVTAHPGTAIAETRVPVRDPGSSLQLDSGDRFASGMARPPMPDLSERAED